MPHFDRYKNRNVDIEFSANEDFEDLPYPHRHSLVFVTHGQIKARLNDRPLVVMAPAVLCLNAGDRLEVFQKTEIAAQSFRFHPDFFVTARVIASNTYKPSNVKMQTGLSLFQRDKEQSGVPPITGKAFLQLREWFFVLGTEVNAHSDALWVCRIKKYLIQLLRMLEDLSEEIAPSPIDSVLELIHTDYPNKVTLQDLTQCAHLNRSSLNETFQKKYGCTAMGYLLAYRLKVAGELLVHTDMTLDDIARSVGFQYDTYFIKQFTAKREMSPTAFRNTFRNAQ
ncbi:helix-turn-helix transcriptional regulator [Paenibacillus sp. IB182496]|uniref:Helix-turn-helix transcriptional regulator n=1 Tax=Paenibacillus sabuli TaxID=2772509 RepID=A0A927GRN1_9BACL|nr:AraC family transcriptional regulator [Paenibacillus sabuli]MBD2845431.1 helix-turn-helix transcriptional regulator [Paenibacillus sabuli]